MACVAIVPFVIDADFRPLSMYSLRRFYGRERRNHFGVGSGFGDCHDPIRAMIRFGDCPATNHIGFAVLTVLSGPVSDLL